MNKPDTSKFLIVKEPDFEILGEFETHSEADNYGTYLSTEYIEEGRNTTLSLLHKIKSYPSKGESSGAIK